MEKLRLEVTVMVTEKGSLKRELARIESLYVKLQRDFREQRIHFDQLCDELAAVNKKNAGYRNLLVENDQKMA